MANFKTIYEVPRGLRSINGVKLTLDQINSMVAEVQAASKTDGSDFAHHMGKAKQKFKDTHHIVEGHWVVGGDA